MSIKPTFEDLFYDDTYQYIVKNTNFLTDRRRQQKKRSREWRKYRNDMIASGRPDPGRNKYTPNRHYSRKPKKITVITSPPPSEIVLPDYPEIPADILAELSEINDFPEISVDIMDEILNETNDSGGDA